MFDKRMRKLAALLGSAALGMGLFLFLAFLLMPAGEIRAEGPVPGADRPGVSVKTAHVVIQFTEQERLVRPITFTDAISGFRALELAGLDPVADGDNLCSIKGYGSCGAGSPWSAWYWKNSSWKARAGSIMDAAIDEDGQVEAFAWGAAAPQVAGPRMVSASHGLEWLREQQSSDGSWGSSTSATMDTLLAVSSNLYDPGQWRSAPGNPSLLDYLADNWGTDPNDDRAAAPAKTVIGLVGGGHALSATNFAGIDLVEEINDYYDSSLGAYIGFGGGQTHNWDQSWAILGLLAVGEGVPDKAVQVLAGRVNPDGGWGWADDIASDVDSTGLVIHALMAAGYPADSAVIQNGLTYMKSMQADDGGFATGVWEMSSNSNATALAVLGILSTGQDPTGAGWISGSGQTPIDFLQSLQQADGRFYYLPGSAGALFFSTQQSTMAMMGRALPFEPMKYTIAGRVTDAGGDPVGDVLVPADASLKATSDADGYYSLSWVSEGSHRLQPFKSGYVFAPVSRSVDVGPSAAGQNFTAERDGVSGTVTQAGGGTLESGDSSFVIEFPANAVSSDTTVTYTGLLTVAASSLPDGIWVRGFSLEASAGGKPVTQFQQIYTLDIEYEESQLAALGISAESSLMVVYWDGSTWVDAGAVVDTAQNRVTLSLDHFTEFALTGGGGQALYLPILLNNE